MTSVGMPLHRGALHKDLSAVASAMVHRFCALYAQKYGKEGHVEASGGSAPAFVTWEYGVCRMRNTIVRIWQVTRSIALGKPSAVSCASDGLLQQFRDANKQTRHPKCMCSDQNMSLFNVARNSTNTRISCLLLIESIEPACLFHDTSMSSVSYASPRRTFSTAPVPDSAFSSLPG